MPALGADMDEGTLTEWLVHEGDQVSRGDVMAVVETAKSAIEIECFVSGTVTRLLVQPETTVPVGTPLALVEETATQAAAKAAPPAGAAPAAETKPAPTPAMSTSDSPPPAAALPATGSSAVPADRGDGTVGSPLVRHAAADLGVSLEGLHGSGPGGRITRTDVEHAAGGSPQPSGGLRVRASPLARRLARELRVDLAGVTGTGRGGTIRAADVRGAFGRVPEPADSAPEPPPLPATAPGPDRTDSMRQAIAALMSRAKREIPHYYLSTTIDAAAVVERARAFNLDHPVEDHLVPAAFLLKAVATAARQVPDLNGFWIDDRFVPASSVHLGVAVSLRGGGLVAPAIHDADRLSVPELMAALKDVVRRARSGRLRASETADPTLTVTNLGDQGAEAVFGVIYPPQVALVGLGRITPRPTAVDGLLGVRPVVTATLSADHRATDGATGSRFLNVIDRLAGKPEDL